MITYRFQISHPCDHHVTVDHSNRSTWDAVSRLAAKEPALPHHRMPRYRSIDQRTFRQVLVSPFRSVHGIQLLWESLALLCFGAVYLEQN